MSYDLLVFDPAAAPKTRAEFLAWYDRKTQWDEPGRDYDDITGATPVLAGWYREMTIDFPPLNGPDAIPEPDEDDEVRATDYSIGSDVIYAAFAWSLAEEAYTRSRAAALKHGAGFFDVSSGKGEVIFPDGTVLVAYRGVAAPAWLTWLRRLFGGK